MSLFIQGEDWLRILTRFVGVSRKYLWITCSMPNHPYPQKTRGTWNGAAVISARNWSTWNYIVSYFHHHFWRRAFVLEIKPLRFWRRFADYCSYIIIEGLLVLLLLVHSRVIRRLCNIDFSDNIAMGEANGKSSTFTIRQHRLITSVTHTDCVGTLWFITRKYAFICVNWRPTSRRYCLLHRLSQG